MVVWYFYLVVVRVGGGVLGGYRIVLLFFLRVVGCGAAVVSVLR